MTILTSGNASDLQLTQDGAELAPDAIGADALSEMEKALAHVPPGRAGTRLHGLPELARLLSADGVIGALAARRLGPCTRPVRALLFDKTAATNWALGWHQDRTIVVRERIEVQGFGPWSVKSGLQHVAPPYELLAAMITLRLHLDEVGNENAPLLVAPGSHARGRVPEAEVQAVVAECGVRTCLAHRGDVWLYATPILHASDAAVTPRQRRVLQVDYCARDLPGGLEWLGI